MEKQKLYGTLLYQVRQHTVYITLHRPASHNTITELLAAELAEICQDINSHDDIRAVALSGAGEVAFSLGTSAGEQGPPPPAAATIARLYPPTIAVINGDAFGQGLELALSCDIRIAAETARFSMPQVAQGLIPLDGGSQRLPRTIGQARALELLLTGRIVDAAEALDMGLVDRIASPARLWPEAEEMLARLRAKSPPALRYAKEAVLKGMDMTLEQGLRLEADLYFLLHTTGDRAEGIRAFLEKRQPRFQGQ